MRFDSIKKRPFRALALGALALALLAGRAAGAASIVDYDERIAGAIEELEFIKENPAAAREGVARVRELLPPAETVEAGGQNFEADNRWLHDLLDAYGREGEEPARLQKLDEAIARLRALEEHLHALQERAAAGGDDERDRLRAILERPEYREKQLDPLSKFIRETKQKVWDFIADLWSSILVRLFGTSREASWAFRFAVIALVAAALFLAGRTLWRQRGGERRRRKRTVLGEEIEAGATPRDLAEEAGRAAAAGDFRTAMRKLYISLLFELSERRLLELEADATNHEYLRQVARFEALVPPMREMTERFDVFWYGMFPSTAADYAAFLARYREALAQAERLGSAAAPAA